MLQRIITAICLIGMSYVQTVSAQKNGLLPETFRVKYQVNFDSSAISYVQVSEKTLISYIFDKVNPGEIPIYQLEGYSAVSPYGIENRRVAITHKEAAYRLLGGSIDTIQDLDGKGNVKILVLKDAPDLNETRTYNFYEDWFLDLNAFKLTKNVVCYEPIRHFYYPEDTDHREVKERSTFMLFPTVSMSAKAIEQSKKNRIAIAKISYEFFIEDSVQRNIATKSYQNYLDKIDIENSSAPMMNRYAMEMFLGTMKTKLESGSLHAFDYENNAKLAIPEIKKRFGQEIDSIITYDDETGEEEISTLEISADLREIKSIIFDETIYLDPKTLVLTKEINTIAPVRWYYARDDWDRKNMIKEVIFYIKQ